MDSNNLRIIGAYNKWSIFYTTKVQLEYERFMQLKSVYSDLVPSDEIHLFWNTHMLCTKAYYEYCRTKLGKMIHHDPGDYLFMNSRDIAIQKTVYKYKETFGNFIYPEIWCNTTPFNIIYNKTEDP